ncbi:sensor histidine kinase [Ornithinibacillus halophilus]|uniref:histidine kinase n=1 Tax=Ornithinibacillus halophilus TaxID=930117 RepID=A0A1M5LZI7_9BACI|nr:sensor histidine kinase [Ornithinibacillus halophilus]SHG70340.1 Signal transduction histidine kinase [Ornithinibacillus halophilus]
MKLFWLRLIIFIGLWVGIIIQDPSSIAISFLFLSVTLSLFFILSLNKVFLVVYAMLSISLLLYGLMFAIHPLMTILLLLYMTTMASFRLKEKQFHLISLINSIISISIAVVHQTLILETVVISLFIFVLVYSINRLSNEKAEKQAIYEELAGEYRKLKRMNLLTEQDAKLRERNRIARDIHDSVGHRLTALIMQLEAKAIQENDPSYRELKQMAQEGLDETRNAVKALQSEESEGLATVIHLIRKLEAESHIMIQFTTKEGVLSVKLSNEKSIALYRVIQEALTNAMRHAHSREVQIVLGKSPVGDITFEVTNAVYEARPFQFGFGLSNMKKRVDEVDGKLEVYQTEKYFTVKGTIPSE